MVEQDATQHLEPQVITVRAGGIRWRVRLRRLPEEIRGLLETPDAFLIDPAQKLVHSPLITMYRVTSPLMKPPPLLLRRLNYGRAIHRLRDTFRPTRAERAFRHGLAMELARVPTPRVIAVGVRRCVRWPVRAYLLMEFLPNSRTMRELLAAQKAVTRQQTHQLADIMASLHQGNFSHRDLNATNILFDELDRPHFIDLDGVRQYRKLGWGRTIKDLARLAREFIPKGLDEAAPWFLKHYCVRRRLRGQLRPLYKAVLRHLEPFLPSRSDSPRSGRRAANI